MRLQELLEKYKDKLWDWIYRDILIIEDICYCLYTQEDSREIREKKSLSDLLFSTPFLSLLEWKIDASEKVWIHQYIKDERFIEWYSTYENYHKINLVLLNTDEERKSYLENNTI